MVYVCYYAFLVSVFAVWLTASARDRNAVSVVLVATLASLALAACLVTTPVVRWYPLISAGVDLLTIAALLICAKNFSGYLQAGILCTSVATHILCFIDAQSRSTLFYNHYEAIINGVAVAQIVGFYDTIGRCFLRIYSWFASLGDRRLDLLRARVLCTDLLRRAHRD